MPSVVAQASALIVLGDPKKGQKKHVPSAPTPYDLALAGMGNMDRSTMPVPLSETSSRRAPDYKGRSSPATVGAES